MMFNTKHRNTVTWLNILFKILLHYLIFFKFATVFKYDAKHSFFSTDFIIIVNVIFRPLCTIHALYAQF